MLPGCLLENVFCPYVDYLEKTLQMLQTKKRAKALSERRVFCYMKSAFSCNAK